MAFFRKKQKSKISTRARNINMVLLVLILFLMVSISALIIRGINKSNAENLVRAYSIEAAQMFYSYISENLTLVRKAANSKAVTNWYADEFNEVKKRIAFDEVMDYIGLLHGVHIYFGIDKSQNEYGINSDIAFEDFGIFSRMNISNPDDSWYFECMESENDYTIKVDVEKHTKNWRVWINHKVKYNGELVGVFCSGLHIREIFEKIFDKYESKKVRGYIIDRYGVIRSDSTAYDIYNEETSGHIREESTDPAFKAALSEYLNSIDGFFMDRSNQTVIVKLSRGYYEYAAIEPIERTDWSMVVFYRGFAISDITSFILLIAVLLLVLLLYVAGRNTLMNGLIFRPLYRLTKSVSEGTAADEGYYGSDRDDEIGELSRTIRDATHAQQRQEKLLHAVNSAMNVLFAAADDENIKDSILKGMDIIGRSMGVDRIHVWRNELIDGDLCYVNVAKWENEIGVGQAPVVTMRRYAENPEWERKFQCNEYVNGPVSSLTPSEQKIMKNQGVESLLAIPLYMHNSFYGFFSFDDCKRERFFTDEDIEILRSAGLMIVSALNRNAQAIQVAKAHERTQVLLDAMPLSTMIWNTDINMIDCNDETTKLFQVSDKKEFMERFFEFNPEYLPDGTSGKEAAIKHIGKAFEEGRRIVEWMHYMPDGSELPVEVTLVRVKFGDETFVASYVRDLRENKRMIKEIRDTADKLEAVIANYFGIIWCVDRNNIITLFNGRYLGAMNLSSQAFENKNIDEALTGRGFENIRESAINTFKHGPQDVNAEHEGKTYRIRTTPIYEGENVTSVVGSFDDVTERTKLQEDLKAALKNAQEANYAKTRFLARMSHEMRTPLNAIIGLSELTLDVEDLDPNAYENLEKINSAGNTILGTVNDILDISKIEAEKFELVPVEYDVPSMINDAVTQCILRKETKPIEFVLNASENLPIRLFGDDLRIKQILNNLLSNSFKYTEKGKVELNIHCEDEGAFAKKSGMIRLIMQVKDTGVGIREENKARLFTDYTQMDTASHRKIEGTGLGLSITKRLTEMMGGSISVESEYGKGSVFSVIIMQQFVTDEKIGKEVVETLKNFHYSDHKRRKNSKMKRIKLPYARVLVVDDVTTNLDVAKGMLKPYGMKIDCVTSGQQAIDAVRSEKVKYNAIFMDHMMPEMDGIETVRRIREDIGTEYAKTVPIIALTANAIIGNEEMFISKGFQAFLPKPVDITRLDAIVREFVRDENLETEIVEEEPEEAGVGMEISGLDINKALPRYNNNVDSFISVLRSYAKNMPKLLDSISVVNEENIENYKISVHGIKSASRGIGGETVGYMAEALEEAAKARDYSFIGTNNPVFITAIKTLIDKINKALKKKDAENPMPKKDKPDSQTLSRLLEACSQYDMDGVDAAMAELVKYTYKSDGSLIDWLKENVDKLNFAEIKERLENYGKHAL
jgi:signal transduction histidine kinase/DNA-binding response OmpR family regulator